MEQTRRRWQKGSLVRDIASSVLLVSILTACGGGGGSDDGGAVKNNGAGDNTQSGANGGTSTPSGDSGSGGTPASDGDSGSGGSTPVKQSGTISGTVTYDFVPTATRVDAGGRIQGNLDYTKTERRPIRQALVEVLSGDGVEVLKKSVTNDAGVYSIDVPADTRVFVRITAQSVSGTGTTPDYLISVRNNVTTEFARSSATAPFYSMRGPVFTTAANGTLADLNAASGWTGAGYGDIRTAAPFAILDQLVTAAQKMRAAAPDVALPALNAFWSVDNRPAEGSLANGYITTSHYDRNPATKGLYVLGKADVDTDEYDTGVVVHEFGHYVEANLSRSDTFGGPHSMGDALDITVAFSEGYGHAFSSMVRNTPVSTDTIGVGQGEMGVALDLERPSPWSYSAWFDEEAVGGMLWRLYKSPDIGFQPIYQAMMSGQKNTPAFTSVFSFASALRSGLSSAGAAVLDNELQSIQVTGGTQLDEWGTATTRGTWPATTLNTAIFPVYATLTPGVAPNAISCTTTAFGGGNKLGNYGHLRISIPAAGFYRLSLAPVASGPATVGYVAAVYRSGVLVSPVLSSAISGTFNFLAAGDYAAYIAPLANTDYHAVESDATSCVAVSLQAGA